MTNNESENNDDSDNEINLWSREETPILNISINGNKEETSTVIQIRQYGSDSDAWGIHSCVWDGGLALVEYFREQIIILHSRNNNNDDDEKDINSDVGIIDNVVVIDLGSGTGIVGIAMAVLGYRHVILTDLEDALPLLNENIRLNQHKIHHPPVARKLEWGIPIDPQQLFGHSFQSNDPKKLLLIGADIIYRPSLFQPLLSTLQSLFSFHNNNCFNTIQCIFATQSIREHLDHFKDLARQAGFQIQHVCNVNVPQEADETNNGNEQEQDKEGTGCCSFAHTSRHILPPSNQVKPGLVHVWKLTYQQGSPVIAER